MSRQRTHVLPTLDNQGPRVLSPLAPLRWVCRSNVGVVQRRECHDFEETQKVTKSFLGK